MPSHPESLRVSKRNPASRKPNKGRTTSAAKRRTPPGEGALQALGALLLAEQTGRHPAEAGSVTTSFLSEDLNEREEVSSDSVRLNGYSLKSTGVKDRYVGFWDGERIKPMIVVPAGEEVGMMGLNIPYPDGLFVESLRGDGILIVNVFYEDQGGVEVPALEVPDDD